MSDLVCIKVFANYYEATITRGLIEDNGIKAIVSGRDTARPDLELSQGVRLWVKKEDAEKALEVLKISIADYKSESKKREITPKIER